MLGYFYSDTMGLEGASWLRSDQLGRRRVSKGDEFNKAVPAPQALAAPASAAGENVPAPPTSIPRLRPVRVPKLAPGDDGGGARRRAAPGEL